MPLMATSLLIDRGSADLSRILLPFSYSRLHRLTRDGFLDHKEIVANAKCNYRADPNKIST